MVGKFLFYLVNSCILSEVETVEVEAKFLLFLHVSVRALNFFIEAHGTDVIIVVSCSVEEPCNRRNTSLVIVETQTPVLVAVPNATETHILP